MGNFEEQTTQWPKEKVQRDKQRSTKHTYKTQYTDVGETKTLVLYWSCEINHCSNYLFAKCTYWWCCWSTKRNE